MSIEFSKVVGARPQRHGNFSVLSTDLKVFGEMASPIAALDDFRVSGRPFPPHPHAGFSAVTYVFEDSEGSLRSRDSLGNDVLTGPGGIVWTQAGSGVIHEELPADARHELHGMQIFVNLSAKNKLAPPRMFRLEKDQVPEWRSLAGDRVRVVVGAFGGVSSPLQPIEPFTLLDVELKRGISLDVANGNNLLVYVLHGAVFVRAEGREQKLGPEHALALHSTGGRATFEAFHHAQFLVLSAPELKEPVFAQGSFIMNDRAQVNAAVARFRAGQMGSLAPA